MAGSIVSGMSELLVCELGVVEYREALADFMEREVESYRKELGLPDNVSLG